MTNFDESPSFLFFGSLSTWTPYNTVCNYMSSFSHLPELSGNIFRTGIPLCPLSSSLLLELRYRRRLCHTSKRSSKQIPGPQFYGLKFGKGELAGKPTSTRFVPSVSLCGTRQGGPQNRCLKSSLTAFVKGELLENRNAYFILNVSLFKRPNCKVFPLIWLPIYPTMI